MAGCRLQLAFERIGSSPTDSARSTAPSKQFHSADTLKRRQSCCSECFLLGWLPNHCLE
jgi:hypothetical protein